MRRRVVVMCWVGLLVPVVFLSWALLEVDRAADEYRVAWQIYWMGRSDEASQPEAEAQFRAVHPGIGEDRAAEILVMGGAVTLTYYFALLAPWYLLQRRSRSGLW